MGRRKLGGMRLRDGLRELSDDAQHVAFWIGLAVAVVAAIGAGVYWNAWAYVWDVPPPVRGLMALAAAVFVFVLWYFLALVGHHYLGWPKSHPFQMPARNRLAPIAKAPTHQTVIDETMRAVITSRRERALLVSRDSPAQVESIVADEKPRFRVVESPSRDGLSIELHLVSSQPIEHLGMFIKELALWYVDTEKFVRVATFGEARHPWEISASASVRRLHRDSPATYGLCVFAEAGAHIPYVSNQRRTTYRLAPGKYQIDLEFSGGGHAETHETFLLVHATDAEFIGSDAT
jgi:hypothetical protein